MYVSVIRTDCKANIYSHWFQMIFTMNSSRDGFSTICESDKFGKISWEEKYYEGGVHFVSQNP
jgi:hypothetical protein